MMLPRARNRTIRSSNAPAAGRRANDVFGHASGGVLLERLTDLLLTLLVGTVEREVVIERVQALQRLVDPLLSVKKKRW